MGLFDVIRGKRKIKASAEDRLFALTTAYVSSIDDLNIKSKGSAALVLQPLDTPHFNQVLKEAESISAATANESGTSVESQTDSYNYHWLIFKDQDIDDLVVSINAAAGTVEGEGYGDRTLCALFPFTNALRESIYLIYNYKRGSFYPFVPSKGSQSRDTEQELRLKSQLSRELPIEPELEYWLPLWDTPL